MVIFVSLLHVVLCVFMIFVILLQPGKDAGMGAALGGGAATSAFGGRGAVTFLGKVTAVCAIAYFLTSLGLSFVGLKGSVASKIAEEAAKEAPAVPGAPPAPKAPAPAAGADKASDAPKPNDGTTAPEGAAKEAPPAGAVEKASDKPGTPVPSVPEKKVTGTEAGP